MALIEARWQRGPSEEWKSYDFEKLSDEIFDATGVTLSISTLKRLFGKVNYSNQPSLHTLNTLARFTGYEDWNAFKRREPGKSTIVTESATNAQIVNLQTTALNEKITYRERIVRKTSYWWFLLVFPLGVMAYLLLSSTRVPFHQKENFSSFSFSSDKVLTEGVPNSVVFHYDASAAQTDSIFILQTWDMSRRSVVSKTNHEYSAIYYYPGYFNAKLVVDTQVVRTHGLMIGSGGWLAMAEGEPSPYYFKKEEYSKAEAGVVVDNKLLVRNHIPFFPQAPWIRICYIKDMGRLPDDNFKFETTLRSEPHSGTDACSQVEVILQCKTDVFIFALSAPACIGDLRLYAQGKRVTSKDADLSGFGADLTHWTNLRIETVNKHMQFILNNKQVYSLNFHNPTTDIVGVQYRFHGGGSVKDTRFECGDRTIELR
jgi:hypothetical protein